MTPPHFGAAVRLPDGRLGTFHGLVDRRHGRVALGLARRTYPLSDIVEVRAERPDSETSPCR